MKFSYLIVALMTVAQAAPLTAQAIPLTDSVPSAGTSLQPEPLQDAARTADTGTGEVGQRLTRDDTLKIVKPMDRIDNRLANRIGNRLSTRIDRDYDATTNPTALVERSVVRSRKRGDD